MCSKLKKKVLFRSPLGEVVQAWCYRSKTISSQLAESDILSAGAVKAHNDMRQNNTAQLTNGGTGDIKRTFNTEHRACPQIDGQDG